jgi:hypothetical protein
MLSKSKKIFSSFPEKIIFGKVSLNLTFRRSLIAFLIGVGTFFAIVLPSCAQVPWASLNQGSADKPASYIMVDQFGYRPTDKKIAVIIQAEPDLQEEYLTSFARLTDRYQIIQPPSKVPIYEDLAKIWQDGAIHTQSGDRAAWFDFSPVEKPGTYIIQNSRTGKASGTFNIAEDVYREVLIAATRMFFYQRSGFPKSPPYADERWRDGSAFLGTLQDTEAHFVNDKDNTNLARDMRGGWFDAGDTNKYVTFASPAVHQLLDAYAVNSAIWTDDFNIPESGNGIPDLIDEIRFEMDWLKRMQDADGGAFIKLGAIDFSSADRPSLDKRPRYYGPKCSSATIDLAGMFAHAALTFQSISSIKSDVDELGQRASNAWRWYQENPHSIDCDTQEIKSGDADRTLEQQEESAVVAAVYLFALTGDKTYGNYVIDHYKESCPYCYEAWYPYHTQIGDALLYYTQLKQSDPRIQDELLDKLSGLKGSSAIYSLTGTLDPYRAYMQDDQYHWGSNAIKASYGITNYDIDIFYPHTLLKDSYQSRALDYLHYFHGVNPLGLVYLTNMYEYGAEYSANEMWHEWFGNGIYDNALISQSGPAPGYLTGGPNKNYTGKAEIPKIYPLKSYLDSNESGDMSMWEITEPAIYYQSAYLKLLARFLEPQK